MPPSVTSSKVTQFTHPSVDGWLHVKMTLKTADPLSTRDLHILACYGGEPKFYDIALAEQRGKYFHGVARSKTWHQCQRRKGVAA